MTQPSSPEHLISRGLAGIEVDDSAISLVEGARGRLSYRGISIDKLIDQPFTAVAKLVLDGTLPGSESLQVFEAALLEMGTLDERELKLTRLAAISSGSGAGHPHPMQILQGMVPMLSFPKRQTKGRHAVPESLENYAEGRDGLIVAARLPRLIALIQHQSTGTALPEYPRREPDFNRRFLTQLQGRPPTHHQLRAFNVCQILQIEHSFNASTFAARVVASTLAPVQNCISAALGALHGPLHGGADQAALETADRVAYPERAAAFVDDCLARGTKVMGMGHREYKVLDPRARYVKELARELSLGTEHETTYATLAAIEARFNERMQEEGKTLYANLEFYKGILYRMLGLTPECFTATFAMARVFGYIAHFLESRENNHLMRPQAHYVGLPVV